MSYRARVLIPLLVIALAGGWLIYLTTSGTDATTAAAATTEAVYSASFPDAAGQLQPLSQWRDRVMVVNFWATWCPPCLEEMPELSSLQDKYRDRNLTIVGISTDDVAKVSAYSQDTPVSYPLLAADFEGMNLAESLGNDKGVLPYTVVLQADGKIASIHYGRLDIHALEQALIPLLQP